MKALVTGGCGFIGSALVHRLMADGHDVVNLDALTYAGVRASVEHFEGDARYRFVHGDVCSRPTVDDAIAEADVVFHLAAESHVDRSISGAALFIRTNVLGTQVVCDAALQAGVRLIQVGTDEVYGSIEVGRFTEDSPLVPTNPYAASKAGADLVALSYARTHGLDVVVTRCSNNFGPRQLPEKLIPLAVTNVLRGRPVPVYGDGLQVRDWIHVDDHVGALLFLAEHGVAGTVYNVGADNERTNRAVIDEILGELGGSWVEVTDRLAHDRRYAIDAGRLAALGFTAPRRPLGPTLAWYRANPGWWEPLLAE
ncbi:MAG: dTDP-glucose 4,6-dehydratase [Proteobacteria bacterium]|nr:dTDP-glucose 4,6-dehydratase [Pseudomonadota bacterium]MCP4917413.1 dTDP-glucose 4,6-dehydratase [Pseudomonadota bacterium]